MYLYTTSSFIVSTIWGVPQLSANNSSIFVIPILITYSAPCTINTYFYSTNKFICTTSQTYFAISTHAYQKVALKVKNYCTWLLLLTINIIVIVHKTENKQYKCINHICQDYYIMLWKNRWHNRCWKFFKGRPHSSKNLLYIIGYAYHLSLHPNYSSFIYCIYMNSAYIIPSQWTPATLLSLQVSKLL